jgi:hypothetical protein
MSQQGCSLFNLSVPVAPGVVLPYRFVDFTGLQATVQGQKVAGVANHGAAAAGASFDFTVIGTAIVEAGAAFAVGHALISDASGRAIPNSGALIVGAGAVAMTSTAANGAVLTGSDLPEWVAAEALQAAVNVGDLVEVLLVRR